MSIDPETHNMLSQLEFDINAGIDSLIIKRQAADHDKYLYRYVNNKLQVALGAINRALDKIEAEM